MLPHRRRGPATWLPGLALAGMMAAGMMAGCGSGGSPKAARPSPTAGGAPTPAATATPPAGEWTTYQASATRLGQAGPTPALSPLHLTWSARLDGGAVYGQPLLYGGKVIVATEADDVYGLDPATGAVAWQVNLGVPLRHVATAAGCGDIDPLGITSTPVVDPATGTVYVVAEVSTAGRPPVHHQLVGIDVATGKETLSVDADPALPTGQSPLHLLQRAALALAGGRVYIGYGGQYGDCGTYSGWVVAVPTSGTGGRSFDVTPASTGGAVWDGGSGPAVGTSGAVYVTTGNPNSGGQLWALRYPGGILQELDPVTGRVRQSLPVGRSVAHFASLSVVGGLVLVPTTAGVEAFSGPGGPATP